MNVRIFALIFGAATTRAGFTKGNIAAEAATLGSADGALSDAAHSAGQGGGAGPTGTAGPGGSSHR